MLQFHIRFFYRSTYFFMFRRPDAVITSMKKLFPDKAYGELATVWLRTVDVFYDFINLFPHVRVIVFENFGPRTLATVSSILGIDLTSAKQYVDAKARETSSADARATWADPDMSRALPMLQDVYDQVVGEVDGKNLAVRTGVNPFTWDALRSRLAQADDVIRNLSGSHLDATAD